MAETNQYSPDGLAISSQTQFHPSQLVLSHPSGSLAVDQHLLDSFLPTQHTETETDPSQNATAERRGDAMAKEGVQPRKPTRFSSTSTSDREPDSFLTHADRLIDRDLADDALELYIVSSHETATGSGRNSRHSHDRDAVSELLNKQRVLEALEYENLSPLIAARLRWELQDQTEAWRRTGGVRRLEGRGFMEQAGLSTEHPKIKAILTKPTFNEALTIVHTHYGHSWASSKALLESARARVGAGAGTAGDSLDDVDSLNLNPFQEFSRQVSRDPAVGSGGPCFPFDRDLHDRAVQFLCDRLGAGGLGSMEVLSSETKKAKPTSWEVHVVGRFARGAAWGRLLDLVVVPGNRKEMAESELSELKEIVFASFGDLAPPFALIPPSRLLFLLPTSSLPPPNPFSPINTLSVVPKFILCDLKMSPRARLPHALVWFTGPYVHSVRLQKMAWVTRELEWGPRGATRVLDGEAGVTEDVDIEFRSARKLEEWLLGS